MDEQMNNPVRQEPGAPAPEVKPEAGKVPPRSASPKKELTPAQLQRRRKMVVLPLFFLVFCGAIWLIFAPSGSEKADTAGQSGLNVELPTPTDEGIYSDKRTAYEQEARREREQAKVRNLSDFSTMLGQGEEQAGKVPEPAGYDGDSGRSRSGTPPAANGNAIQTSAVAYQDINRQLGSWYDRPATEQDEQAQLAVEWRVQELERRLGEAEAKKAEEDEQTALLEKSYQLAARYMLGGVQPAPVEETATTPPAASGNSGQKVNVQPVSRVRKSEVSLLSAPTGDREFIDSWNRPRNMGFITAAGNEGVRDKNSIRACVYQTATLVSGSELKMRLLEPMQAGNFRIPVNTVITGSCRISGERMDVSVSSIQYGDNIIPVELLVYETDGQRGIFVPNSDEINAAKEIAAQMAQSAGTSITITDEAGSQFAADMGKSLIQGVSQYVSKKLGVVKVTVKANHGLLLLPKMQ
ncbi:conjugative transposon protein TraM [Parabacteroides sp. AF48-14]|uniref:conjugative transposon protein TraM n=1 Tax=Parabacteroides sp. AF48-14 TaxID=2292052 RepID=UPI000F00BC4A|nr:conjugative transposon protein TraM [Parabacteroides sp. AF48-14]